MADEFQENYDWMGTPSTVPETTVPTSVIPQGPESFIPQREEPAQQPNTVGNYLTPEEAKTRFAQYLPIEATPNDILLPSDDPRVYTYQMQNGNIYYIPAFEEQLAERRTVGEAFSHLVDNFPSRTEVEEGLLNLPQAAYGAVRNMVTGQGNYEDVVGTALGLVGTRTIPRSRYTDEFLRQDVEQLRPGQEVSDAEYFGHDSDAIDAYFEPLEEDIFEQQPFVPDGDWTLPEDIAQMDVPTGNQRPLWANEQLQDDWRVPVVPLREGKLPTSPLYPPRDYTPNGYEPEDTIVFRSPVRDLVAGMQVPSQGIKGSQFIKMLQDNPSIRNSEVRYLDLGISPEARYTREELQQLVDSRLPQVEAYFDRRFDDYQRQPVVDPQTDYTEIVISAWPQNPNQAFRANSQHFDENALAHTRVSIREPEMGENRDRYLLVEEMQSDLIQKGWKEPTPPRTFAEYIESDLQDYIVYMDHPEVEGVVRQVYDSLPPEQWLNLAKNENWSSNPFMEKVVEALEEIDLPETLPNNYNVMNGISAVIRDYATKEAFRTNSLPPIRNTQESTRLIVESLLAYADRSGVDEIVFPPFERIVAERFRPGSKDYEKALTPGSGFHQTYITSLKKVIQELQNELGRNAISVYPRQINYGKTSTPSVDFEDARWMWNYLQLMRGRIRREFPNASLQDVDGEIVERLTNTPSYLTGFEAGSMLDEYTNSFGDNFMSARNLDEFYEGNARMSGTLLPTEGIGIYIGGLRNQYNLQYPRFAEGGLVTQTRSAFGEIA